MVSALLPCHAGCARQAASILTLNYMSNLHTYCMRPCCVRKKTSEPLPPFPQAVWALGNIAGDSPKCRDYVLNFNAMAPLLEQLVESSKITMLRNATWTLSNFCRGKPSPSFNIVSYEHRFITL